jgi:arsenate reductase
VLTCTQADEACPLVPGCELRLPIRYEDPKVADDTPQEANRYQERTRQICREMLYAMSLVS